ncbi:hypothetical protein CIHG_00910 [Coccidioides immitis H538.4]|nr:hypothetical protein CIHG_00910 [Coccidioides immitis H538.4]
MDSEMHKGTAPVRGRGRGASAAQLPHSRGGYVSVERVDPTTDIIHNNPNFRPRPYNAVPPPTNLNHRGSHRGRGRGAPRGRGRGALGRGRGTATAES